MYEFLRKNIQIQSLSLSGVTSQFLREISQILPHISKLVLIHFEEMFPYWNEEIHFENVILLQVGGTHPSIPNNITLPKLIEFCGDVQNHKIQSDSMSLLKRNPSVRKIYFETCSFGKEVETLT